MAGLFDTPEQVKQQERQARASTQTGPAQGALFNLGHDLTGLLTRALGGDSTSVNERRAGRIQAEVQDTDFSDRKSVFRAAKRLNDGGFTAEAAQILELMPDVGATTFGPQTTTETDIVDSAGNVTTRSVTSQTDSAGEVHKIDAFTGKAFDDGSGGRAHPQAKLNDTFTTGRALPPDIKNGIVNQMQNYRELNGMFSQPDAEEVEAHIGGVQQIEQEHLREERTQAWNQYFKAIDDGMSTDLAKQLLTTIDASPDRWQKSMDLYRESGLLAANSTNSFMGAEEAAITKTMPIGELRKKAAIHGRQKEALSKAEREHGGMIQTDPRGKGFRLSTLPTDLAFKAFGNIENLSNEDLESLFIKEGGYDFTNQASREWHHSNWDRMRQSQQNKDFVKAWFPGTIRERALLHHNTKKELWGVDKDQWPEVTLMHRYLSNLTGKRTKEQGAAQKVLDQLGTDAQA